MNGLNSLGIRGRWRPGPAADVIEYVVVQQTLRRVMAFAGFSIDDVVNNLIAKNAVLGYYKAYKQVERGCEVVDLERQWNRVG
jgi:hypothetical protein